MNDLFPISLNGPVFGPLDYPAFSSVAGGGGLPEYLHERPVTLGTGCAPSRARSDQSPTRDWAKTVTSPALFGIQGVLQRLTDFLAGRRRRSTQATDRRRGRGSTDHRGDPGLEPSLRQVAAEAVAEPRSGLWADDCLKPSLRQVAAEAVAEAVADDLRMPPTDSLDLKRLLQQFHAAQHLQSLAAQQQARDREDNERRHRQTQGVA